MSCEPSRAPADRAGRVVGARPHDARVAAAACRTLRSPSSASIGPKEAFVESRRGWQRQRLPFADFEWCSRLAKLVANSTQQRVDVDGTAPVGFIAHRRARAGGAAAGHLAGMRGDRNSPTRRSRVEHRRAGAAGHLPSHATGRAIRSTTQRRSCCACWRRGITGPSCASRCAARKNILVSGPTGSGKTTWTKALIREIRRTNG